MFLKTSPKTHYSNGVFGNVYLPAGQHCPNVSTTPITAMGCRQCLPISVVQLKGKHCRKPHCRNGDVDHCEENCFKIVAVSRF